MTWRAVSTSPYQACAAGGVGETTTFAGPSPAQQQQNAAATAAAQLLQQKEAGPCGCYSPRRRVPVYSGDEGSK